MTTKSELLKMIRMNCSQCMGEVAQTPVKNPSDIEACTSKACIYFEYRFGKDPYPSPSRQAGGRNFRSLSQPGLAENNKYAAWVVDES
jgi:hypothetical protein